MIKLNTIKAYESILKKLALNKRFNWILGFAHDTRLFKVQI